jgi:hypothetical protein
MQPGRNYSKIFNIFNGAQLTLPARVWKLIGVASFVAASLAFLYLSSVGFNAQSTGLTGVVGQFCGFSFLLGFFAFAIVGIYYHGSKRGSTTFLGSLGPVLSKVFLYILLPAAIATAIIIVWAIATHQIDPSTGVGPTVTPDIAP